MVFLFLHPIYFLIDCFYINTGERAVLDAFLHLTPGSLGMYLYGRDSVLKGLDIYMMPLSHSSQPLQF